MKYLALALLLPLALASTVRAEPPAKIAIAVTKRGFDPDAIVVPAKTPVTLVFTRKTEQTCAKTVVIKLDDGKQVERELPLGTPIEIAVTFPKSGTLTYACNMDMTRGTIVVQ